MLYNRIKSKSGATILIALLFFLLCAMAGSVILAAGSASAGRLANVQEQEQAYYTVTSAAQLVRDQIEHQKLTYQVTTTDGVKGEPVYEESPNSQLSGLLKVANEHIFTTKTAYTDTITISPSSPSEYPQLSEVIGTVTVDADYNIEIILKISDGAKDAGMYTCTVTIPTVVAEIGKTSSGNTLNSKWTKRETRVQWGEATITKG